MNPPILSPPMPVLWGHAGPNHLTSLRFSDGRQRVVLDGELPQVGGCVEVLGTVAVNSTGDVFSVRLPGGGGGNVGLANLLQLRASPQAAPLQAGPADPDTPQPGQPTHTSGDGGLPRFTFFVHDHLENSRVLYANKLAGCGSAQARYVLEHVLDYYPYGRTLREHAVAWERFQTTHHERDPETGLDYRGARFYDGDVGRFLSCDPLAADYTAWSTYNYVLGNPVRLVDPDGRAPESADWIPTVNSRGDIVLKAEPGDNQKTLVQFFGSQENAERYLPSYALNGRLDIQEGSQIKLNDNVFSKATRDFKQNFINEDNSYDLSYNCHTSCILGTQQVDFSNRRYEEGNIDESDRDKILMEKYAPVSPIEAEFGNTIITFNNDHSAIFFGRSKDGTGYVWEKPNFVDGPQITKTKDVSKRSGGIQPSKAFGGQDYGLYKLRNQ